MGNRRCRMVLFSRPSRSEGDGDSTLSCFSTSLSLNSLILVEAAGLDASKSSLGESIRSITPRST